MGIIKLLSRIFFCFFMLATTNSLQAKQSIAIDDESIENEIYRYHHVEELVKEGKLERALQNLKLLKTASYAQIKVHSLFLRGEIFFIQNEFDLSMQIFKKIITRYAYSGIVYKTLQRLIVCSQKLKLTQDMQKYSSLLMKISQGKT